MLALLAEDERLVYRIRLGNDAPSISERFAQALLSPPDPSPALERAFVRRRKLLSAE